jgi:hypothetical protein
MTKSLQLTCIMAPALFISTLSGVARAQTPPTPLFQNATLSGSGNTITATRVPVVISATQTIYVDIAIQFNSDANGVLTIANGFPQINQSPNLLTGGFQAGTYLGPLSLFNGKGLISVSGPTVEDGGYTFWSLTTAPGTDPGVYPTSANWYVGPIANNPYAARINAAKITNTTYSYGIMTSSGGCIAVWCTAGTGNLIGVSQTGNVLSIATFSYEGGSDQNVPYAILTFTKQ